jgi:hypothetical protein
MINPFPAPLLSQPLTQLQLLALAVKAHPPTPVTKSLEGGVTKRTPNPPPSVALLVAIEARSREDEGAMQMMMTMAMPQALIASTGQSRVSKVSTKSKSAI